MEGDGGGKGDEKNINMGNEQSKQDEDVRWGRVAKGGKKAMVQKGRDYTWGGAPGEKEKRRGLDKISRIKK